MATFIVRTINSSFFTEGEVERPQSEDALSYGVLAAVMIASDEIRGGAIVSAVEVEVSDEAKNLRHRVAVSLGVAPLAMHTDVRKPAPVESNGR